eukprot:TRINITY_DN2797_c0_g1_i6.p1 TRINITY_DN2797_c0_g1~~TRINITY_DN2797_c0_g1_i6.p1  ORF type:complete len:464 (-),score=110.43 TRINITY_DN2797_c0_g1_i6:103-1494(-)
MEVTHNLSAADGPVSDAKLAKLTSCRFARTDGTTNGCNDIHTYCGGTFRGIINNLDYITGMGFDAIWISPIVDNTPGGYHGYWAKNLYQLNPQFGTEQDFIDLIRECHARDVWVMVDVVGNHVGPVGFDFGQIDTFNKPEHYHDYCQINMEDFANNQWRVEHCRLADLPDLNQDNPFVRQTLLNWISNLIKKYQIDGIRIDTIPEVAKDFWTEFSQAAGVFTIGEAFDPRYDYVAGYQGPLDATLNYPLYFELKAVLQQGRSMYDLRDHYKRMGVFREQEVLGNFIDNHDNARFLHCYDNLNRWKTGVVFTLMSVGIPIFYYGGEQGYAGGDDPNNRETLWTNMNPKSALYGFVKAIIATRKTHQTWASDQIERYVDDNFYAFSRGDVFVATTNVDKTINRTISYHPYHNGEILCDVFFPDNDCILVLNGVFNVVLLNGEPKIFVPRNPSELQAHLRGAVSQR